VPRSLPRIRRRAALAGGAAAATVAALSSTADAAASTPRLKGRRPNIIVILADDFGYGSLGSYGQQVLKTPNIDRLAREGIRFTQGYSGASVCAPSRTTLLTGMHGGHSRVRSNTMREGTEPRLLEQDTTFAQVLKAAGYKTGIFGKWGFGDDDVLTPAPIGVTCDVHLPDQVGTGKFDVANRRDPSHPLQKGFDKFLGLVTTYHAFQYWPDYLWRNNRRVHLPANEGGDLKGAYAPQAYLDAALEFIDDHKKDEFLLYFAPQLVHFPIQVPDTKAYDDQVGWTPDMKGYASQYTLLDTYVGQIVDLLKKRKIADDTLIIFTGDNGPTPNEHLLVGSSTCADTETQSADSFAADYLWNTNGGLRAGKHSLYDGGIRVPLIAWGPGVVRRTGKSSVADQPWGSVDLLPTLADFAGVTPPSDVDGVSVRDWITGEKRRPVTHPPLYFERPPAGDQNLDGGPPSQLVYTTAIRWGQYKGVRHAVGKDPLIPDAQADFELYDLKTDPTESVNIAHLQPDVSHRLESRMRASHSAKPTVRKRYRARRTGGEFILRRR
jgi:arylsulfatase A-like enzyme